MVVYHRFASAGITGGCAMPAVRGGAAERSALRRAALAVRTRVRRGTEAEQRGRSSPSPQP